MLTSAIIAFFEYKYVGSIILLTCSWNKSDQVKFVRGISHHGMRVGVSCDTGVLDAVHRRNLQGVVYIEGDNDTVFSKVKTEHFSNWYKWLIVGDELPSNLQQIRYDADMVFYNTQVSDNAGNTQSSSDAPVKLDVIYIQPSGEVSLHSWAHWRESGLQVTHEGDRISRKLDLKRYPLKIAAPVVHYSPDHYNGTFKDYLVDEKLLAVDSSLRSGYGGASLLVEALNATEVLSSAQYWNTLEPNRSSMLTMVMSDEAQLSGAILRILLDRVKIMDYVLPLWPFSVGFTYLAERESSSNMFIEPFSPGVWLSCLGVCVILALAQRLCAKEPNEKEAAFYAVLATWLQQDASAVPTGVSGRWTFIVMSISSMLVYAYYTSAIVSALMDSGLGGPTTLRELGDSKYAIATEDFEYMRYLFFDTNSHWDDMEYLKKKKMSSNMYLDIHRGVELVKGGTTAYHTEYNDIYFHLRMLNDEQVCKLKYVDTIPESLTWIVTGKRSQWTEVFRSKAAWVREAGLASRVVSHVMIHPAPCRATMLAERVRFGDVAPLLGLTAAGALLSFVILVLEMMLAKIKKKPVTN